MGAYGQSFRHIIRDNSISALQRNLVDMHQGDLFLPSLSVFRVYSNYFARILARQNYSAKKNTDNLFRKLK